MLISYRPYCCTTEIEWIITVIFGEYLGISFSAKIADNDSFEIHYDGRILHLPNIFFCKASEFWLLPASLPALPLKRWAVLESGLDVALIEKTIPVLFGQPGFYVDHSGNGYLNLDIFGSAFYMLSRYEEAVLPNRDKHNRFQACMSIAQKERFLHRPIVDEYVEILWSAIKRLWPHMERKRIKGKLFITCDVDAPFDPSATCAARLLKAVGGDIVKRRNIDLACRRINNYIASRNGDYRHDPYIVFEWYMDVCEKHGHRATFFFIAEHSAGTIDGYYEITDKRIMALLRRITERGHDIGMHGSYNSYQNAEMLRRERNKLISVCEQAGANASVAGNRQHYMRWDSMQTPEHLEQAGFQYDTTGSFADEPGFRYGTSRSFPMWDWKNRRGLKLVQRPLIVMEKSLLSKEYMNITGYNRALESMLNMKRNALKYNGHFTVLWHNNHLTSLKERNMFETLLT